MSRLTKQVMYSELLMSPFEPIHINLKHKSAKVFLPDEAK